MSVNHAYHKMTRVPFANTELTVNHMFTRKQTQEGEAKFDKVMTYVLRYENPFEVSTSRELKLHNFITRAIISDEVRKALLSVKEIGANLYGTFRNEHIVEKTKRICDIIPRNKLKTFASTEGKTPMVNKNAAKANQESIARKQLDIVRVRGHYVDDVFKYHFLKTSYLYDDDYDDDDDDEDDDDGPTTHELVKELECS